MVNVPRWAGRYIGLPWVDGGRDFTGVDCEGLARLVLKHEAGDPGLPSYGLVSADGLFKVSRAIEQNKALPPWVNVTKPRRFDWALLTGRGRVDSRPRTLICHMGIMLSETLLLHIEKATHSVVVDIGHPLVGPRVVCFIRHEAFT